MSISTGVGAFVQNMIMFSQVFFTCNMINLSKNVGNRRDVIVLWKNAGNRRDVIFLSKNARNRRDVIILSKNARNCYDVIIFWKNVRKPSWCDHIEKNA